MTTIFTDRQGTVTDDGFISDLEGFESNVFNTIYRADATGVIDGASKLQAVIDAIETQGGGLVSQRYGYLNIGDQVSFKKHVAVQGWADERAFPQRQATAGPLGTVGEGTPNTSMRITRGATGSILADDATLLFQSNTGGLRNIMVSYPNQRYLDTETTPIDFNFLIGIKDKIGWEVKNVQAINAYNFLKTEGLTGIGSIHNISISPFGGTTFHFDELREATFGINTNAWKYGGVESDGNTLAQYNARNSIFYKMGQVDGHNNVNSATYDVKTHFELYNNGDGAPWVNFANFTADNNVLPFVARDFNIGNFVNGSLQCDNEDVETSNSPILVTNEVTQAGGNLNICNVDLYRASHGITTKHSVGTVNLCNISQKSFTNLSGPGQNQGNAITGATFIDEGNGGITRLMNVSRGKRSTVEDIFCDGAYTTIDGYKLPNRGTDTSLTGWDDAANWTGSGAARLTNVTDGIQADVTGTYVDALFGLPSSYEQGCPFVMEVKYQLSCFKTASPATKVAISSGTKFGMNILLNSGSIVVCSDLFTQFRPRWHDETTVIFPILIPRGASSIVFSFGGQPTTDGDGDATTCTVNITDLKIYRPDRQYLSRAYFDHAYGTSRYTTGAGKFFDIINGKYRVLGTAAPTDGTWEVGDIVYDSATGNTFRCTVAGTPGTWITDRPNLTQTFSITVDWPSLASGATQTVLVTSLSDVELGDVILGVSSSISSQLTVFWGQVEGSGNVRLTHYNPTGGPIDLASCTMRFTVLRV